MRDESLLDRVQAIFREELDDDELVISIDTTSEDIADWDSLAQVRLVAAIEREFDIQFDLSEIEELMAVRDFIDRLKSHMQVSDSAS